jgi:hypothetical protein
MATVHWRHGRHAFGPWWARWRPRRPRRWASARWPPVLPGIKVSGCSRPSQTATRHRSQFSGGQSLWRRGWRRSLGRGDPGKGRLGRPDSPGWYPMTRSRSGAEQARRRGGGVASSICPIAPSITSISFGSRSACPYRPGTARPCRIGKRKTSGPSPCPIASATSTPARGSGEPSDPARL